MRNLFGRWGQRSDRGPQPEAPGLPLQFADAPDAPERLDAALYLPGHGAAVDPRGRVIMIGDPLGASLTSDLPDLRPTADGPVLFGADAAPSHGALAAFVSWKARFNFAHFLLDALPGVVRLQHAGLLTDHRLAGPPLTDWQRVMLRRVAGLGVEEPIVLEPPIVRATSLAIAGRGWAATRQVDEAVLEVRERLLDGVVPAAGSPTLLYLRSPEERRLTTSDDDLLEAELRVRGVLPVTLDRLPIARQIALLNGAHIVVSASRTALAAVLFCRPGVHVYEIRDDAADDIGAICAALSLRWRPFDRRLTPLLTALDGG